MAAPAYQPAPQGYPPAASLNQAAPLAWVQQIATVCNLTQQGKLNASLDIVLAANANSTTIIDARLSAFSVILFMPLTANAAAEQAAGAMYVSAQNSGTATVTHANDPATDRSFRMLIIS